MDSSEQPALWQDKHVGLKIISERLHVDGMLIRLAAHDAHTFVVLTEHDRTGLSWGTQEGGTAEDGKTHIDSVLRTIRHDCLELGCPPWLDHSD